MVRVRCTLNTKAGLAHMVHSKDEKALLRFAQISDFVCFSKLQEETAVSVCKVAPGD